jgi:hypothetical protein
MAVDLIRSRTTLRKVGQRGTTRRNGKTKTERRQIVETLTEARQTEPCSSVLVLLVIGTPCHCCLGDWLGGVLSHVTT